MDAELIQHAWDQTADFGREKSDSLPSRIYYLLMNRAIDLPIHITMDHFFIVHRIGFWYCPRTYRRLCGIKTRFAMGHPRARKSICLYADPLQFFSIIILYVTYGFFVATRGPLFLWLIHFRFTQTNFCQVTIVIKSLCRIKKRANRRAGLTMGPAAIVARFLWENTLITIDLIYVDKWNLPGTKEASIFALIASPSLRNGAGYSV